MLSSVNHATQHVELAPHDISLVGDVVVDDEVVVVLPSVSGVVSEGEMGVGLRGGCECYYGDAWRLWRESGGSVHL